MDNVTLDLNAGAVAPVPSTDASGWYAAYVCTNHERRVAQQLNERHVETFLPLYRSVRRWKDRRKELQLALFPSYVFVHMDVRDRLQVLQLPGVVHLVSFGGVPAPLPIARLRRSATDYRTTAGLNPILTLPQAVAYASSMVHSAGSRASSYAEKKNCEWCFQSH